MKLFSKFFVARRVVATTAFSDFIRNASAGDKKRVYEEVLANATKRQNALVDRISRAPDSEVRC